MPSYAPALAAFHRACASSLHAIVRDLPLEPGAAVLDAPCGDGTYLPWFRERVGAKGRVVGADRSQPYLDVARRHLEATRSDAELVKTAIEDLPFSSGSFDLVWCAHSLYSLPDPVTALRELRRVVAPGGIMGVVENDAFHQWMLPWPVELELAVKRAQLVALSSKSDHWEKNYVGRHLAPLLRAAGFVEPHVKTVAVDHAAPLDADERLMLDDYLEGLKHTVWAELDGSSRKAFTAFGNDLDRPDFTASHLEIVATARNP